MDELRKHIAIFLPYLEDLRRRLYWGAILFITALLGGFLFAEPILRYTLSFVHVPNVIVAISSPFQFADVATDIGFTIAIIVTVPYLIFSCYAFIAPALTPREKRMLFTSVPLTMGLFLVGFAYGFYIMFYALDLIAGINTSLGIANIWDISELLFQMFITALLLGVVFELPLVVTLLIKMGLLDVRFLKNHRRIAWISIVILVSLLPPTDGVSLIVMSLPLVLLYEMTILFNNKRTHAWIGK